MSEDALVPLLIDGQEVGRVRLAPASLPDDKRRETNLGLGIVQLPSLLENYRPATPMAPQERFLRLVRAFVEAMHGQRNMLEENELARRYMGTHGILAALHHQVRRASGESVCAICQRRYSQHKYERAILNTEGKPYIHRLCNGDLVKL